MIKEINKIERGGTYYALVGRMVGNNVWDFFPARVYVTTVQDGFDIRVSPLDETRKNLPNANVATHYVEDTFTRKVESDYEQN